MDITRSNWAALLRLGVDPFLLSLSVGARSLGGLVLRNGLGDAERSLDRLLRFSVRRGFGILFLRFGCGRLYVELDDQRGSFSIKLDWARIWTGLSGSLRIFDDIVRALLSFLLAADFQLNPLRNVTHFLVDFRN